MAMSNVISSIRAEKGLTQEQMARDLFVTRQAVSRWELGESTPGIDMVKLICVTYCQTPEEQARLYDMLHSMKGANV